LHPLVIINISDHATRARVNNNGKHTRVVGVLLGKQRGKEVDLLNSFEALIQETSEGLVIDHKYLEEKLLQFAEVFPDNEFLGWYSTGSAYTEHDTLLHKQLMR